MTQITYYFCTNFFLLTIKAPEKVVQTKNLTKTFLQKYEIVTLRWPVSFEAREFHSNML